MDFKDLSVHQRINFLFNGKGLRYLDSDSDLLIATGHIGNNSVTAVFTDPAAQLGTFGCRECADLINAVDFANSRGDTLVLGLDSAGTRLSDGIAALGMIRKAFRSLCDVKLDGTAIAAFIGKHAFGSASMLAYSADVRIFEMTSAFAMTGPKAMVAGSSKQMTLGQARLCVEDPRRFALNRGDCVNRGNSNEYLALATAAIDRAKEASASKASSSQNLLQDRLLSSKLGGILVGGITMLSKHGETQIDLDAPNGLKPSHCLGLIRHFDAVDVRIEREVRLHVRCPGHCFDLDDEALIQSQYLVHLTLAMRKLVRSGIRVEVVFETSTSGGAYIAFAAGASAVHVAPDAFIEPLPPHVVHAVMSAGKENSILKNRQRVSYHELGLIDSKGSVELNTKPEIFSCEEM